MKKLNSSWMSFVLVLLVLLLLAGLPLAVYLDLSNLADANLRRQARGRQAAIINGMNVELETANGFLGSLSTKISRYLPPQIL